MKAMDFVHGQSATSRRIMVLTVVELSPVSRRRSMLD